MCCCSNGGGATGGNQEVNLQPVACYGSDWWLVSLAKLWFQVKYGPDSLSSGEGLGSAHIRF